MPTFKDFAEATPEEWVIFDPFGNIPERKGQFLKLSQRVARAIEEEGIEEGAGEASLRIQPEEELGPKAQEAFKVLKAFILQT